MPLIKTYLITLIQPLGYISNILGVILMLLSFNVNAQHTEVKYLSGTGFDDTVDWEFFVTEGRKSGAWTTIPVPSQWEQEGFGTYNYGHDLGNPEKEVGYDEGIYKYSFQVPQSWEEKSVDIVFEGSMTDTEVRINGQSAGPVHQGAFYRFKYDISELLEYGSANEVEVTVSKMSSNVSVNEAERMGDYWVFGGIFRPVYLEAKPEQHIERWAVDARASGRFEADIFLKGDGEAAYVSGQIKRLDGTDEGTSFRTNTDSGTGQTRLSTTISDPELWSPEFPNLYDVEFYLHDENDQVIHQVEERFGFRTVELRKQDGFYVNGEKIRFRGVNRHSFWPESGRTTNRSLSIRDVELMKDMNINAVRMSHYPPDKHFLEVCDSLGLFVINELAGWHDAYDTEVGRKLVREMVVRDVNHPSIVIWSNGNEGGNNAELDDDFAQYDPQDRPLIHPWTIINGMDTQHYKDYNCCPNRLFNGDEVFFPTEFLHGLYDGGHGAGLQDFWDLMRSKPLSAGGFLWVFSDECVERTDQEGSLDCDGNHAPDGIVGPFREKEGSFHAIKSIWSPVQIFRDHITSEWDQTLRIENRFFYTNLQQITFDWKLVAYPGPFDDNNRDGYTRAVTVDRGRISAPDIEPQHSGYLQVELPPDWNESDALELTATDPHGRHINTWSWPLKNPQDWVGKTVGEESGENTVIDETDKTFELSSGEVTASISRESGYIERIERGGQRFSLNGGPFITSDRDDDHSLEQIWQEGGKVKAVYSGDNYTVTYSISNDWLKVNYSYKPNGEYSYYGVGFNYPENKVNGIKWLGSGPYRVWKNRLAGMEYGLWQKQYNEAVTGHKWNYPEFKGYHARFNWGVMDTEEGPVTMMVSRPGIYLGLFRPQMPPDPANTEFEYPEADLSFMHAISPIGTKFKLPGRLGPSGQPNIFQYSGADEKKMHYRNSLWFYVGDVN